MLNESNMSSTHLVAVKKIIKKATNQICNLLSLKSHNINHKTNTYQTVPQNHKL